MFGVHRPDGGAMSYRGAAYQPSGPADALAQGIAMVHQHFSLVGDMSVVDNVLLGRPLVQPRLDAVLAGCALLEDLAALPAGLHTEVGERGVTLSGGQCSRVALARAMYDEPELLRARG